MQLLLLNIDLCQKGHTDHIWHLYCLKKAEKCVNSDKFWFLKPTEAFAKRNYIVDSNDIQNNI